MIKIIKVGLLLVSFVATIGGQIAFAQTIPDAGTVRREIESTAPPPEPKKPDAYLESTPASAPRQTPSIAVIVSEFRFTGNTLIETEELKKSLVRYLKRPLSFDELEATTARVAEVYRQSGWVVRSYLPPQDISGGQVTIAIVEATYGVTRVSGGTPKRVSVKRLTRMIKAEQPKGQFINANALDKALRRINELPAVHASGVLSAGEESGETDLVLNLKQTSVVSGNVVLDNAGSKYTGEHRLIATGFLNSPSGYGEQYSTTVLYSEGTTFGRFAATVPVGISGWRLGAHASLLNYSLGEDFGVLGAEGSSTEYGLDSIHPLFRSRNRNLTLAMSYKDTHFENSTAVGVASEYSVGAVEATLYGQLFDQGGGANQASLNLVNGSVDDKLTDISSDRFNKLRYTLSRHQRLTERFSLFGSVSGQWADSNLTSSEKFTLGGPSGVRAYRSSEGSGDVGNLLNAEFRVRLPLNFAVAAFYDTGTIQIAKDPTAGDIQGGENIPSNRYSLSGAGLSGLWHSSFGLSIKATWATPLGSNNGPQNADSDQDKDLVWLQASMAF